MTPVAYVANEGEMWQKWPSTKAEYPRKVWAAVFDNGMVFDLYFPERFFLREVIDPKDVQRIRDAAQGILKCPSCGGEIHDER